MQTFLPYSNFELSAKTLDRQRLGKQRVETLQILKALEAGTGGWANHPATRMWKGHTNALVAYGVAICDEWIGRGYKDTCRDKILAYRNNETNDLPDWVGDKAFHRSHRSNLTRKFPEHYSKFWDEPDDLEYIWPTIK